MLVAARSLIGYVEKSGCKLLLVFVAAILLVGMYESQEVECSLEEELTNGSQRRESEGGAERQRSSHTSHQARLSGQAKHLQRHAGEGER